MSVITERTFNVLRLLLETDSGITQREMAENLSCSLGSINSTMKKCTEAGFIMNGHITESGINALKPYKVQNAIIMAAGMSTRFAPLSYEKPKALLKVKNEILIEREIRQLREAGIQNITVVVGYMKETMYYLADKFDVDIVVNEDYYKYNNTSTLIRVIDKLDNTYVCSADNYFTDNIFKAYVYKSFYPAVYADGETDEYCLTYDTNNRITDVSVGGKNAWFMIGPVYFDHDFSMKFKDILKREYENLLTKTQLWENLYMRYIDELDMYIKKFDNHIILEFDSLNELRDFDSTYIDNIDSDIFRNIKSVLKCEDKDIVDIYPVKAGLTNTSFKFKCNGKAYIYRHPGIGTHEYICREGEAEAEEIAVELGLDSSFIYMDDRAGWKLSHFIENARYMDYDNPKDVEIVFEKMHALHNCGKSISKTFDPWVSIKHFDSILKLKNRDNFETYEKLASMQKDIYDCIVQENVPLCLNHCDCYGPNVLFDGDGDMTLIDWEYAGMSDPAVDLATFLACSQYTRDETEFAIHKYLGKDDSPELFRHYVGCLAVISYYWFMWSLYQESVGKPTGEWQYIWYRWAVDNAKIAQNLYSVK